jgi:muconolactone delta-isomerase
MLFHVNIAVHIPRDTDPEKVAQLNAQEHERAKELQLQGKWLHLWRVAGKYANVSIFKVENAEELHDILNSLPLYPFMEVEVTALSHHPGSIDPSEENKKAVVAFYEKALNEHDAETAFRLYGGKSYTQHTPVIEDGQQGLGKFVAWLRDNRPNARATIKRVFAEGDYVLLHVHWIGLSVGERGEAVVDIFRLEGGKVAEHWDVIQPIPESAANSNTMF